MSQRYDSDVEPSSLPATPFPIRERRASAKASFLWTRPSFRLPRSESCRTVGVVMGTDGDHEDDQSSYTEGGRRNDAAASRAMQDEEDVAISQEEEEDLPRRAPPASLRNRSNWKTPTFAARSTQMMAQAHKRSPEGSASADEDHFLHSTLPAAESWRVPLQRRAEPSADRQASVRLNSPSYDERGSDDGLNDDLLPRLQDTDDSEVDDDGSLDAFEMQDYLRYRLRTGFLLLDQRLGQEARHAAQYEEDLAPDQGGLASGGLLEVIGTPGSGKTTLLVQMAIMERLHSLAQAANSLGGKEEWNPWAGNETARQVVLIDTEGSISVQRMAEMADELIKNTLEEWPDDGINSTRPSRGTLLEHTLSGIHISRCTSLCDLLSTFEVLLPSAEYPVSALNHDGHTSTPSSPGLEGRAVCVQDKGMPYSTSLILIDSISYFFRAPTSDERQARRERQHAFMCARNFAGRVHASGIKLVVSNQMSSTFVTQHGQRTQMSDHRALAFMHPILRDWLDERTAADGWRLLLSGIDLSGQRRAAKILSGPASLLDPDTDEEYWQILLPYRIDEHGIMCAA